MVTRGSYYSFVVVLAMARLVGQGRLPMSAMVPSETQFRPQNLEPRLFRVVRCALGRRQALCVRHVLNV